MALPGRIEGLERVERLHKLIIAAVVGGSLAIVIVLLALYATTRERGVLIGALIIAALLPMDLLIVRTLLGQRLQGARALLEALARATGGPTTVASVGGRVLVSSRGEGTLVVATITSTGETLLITAKPGATLSTSSRWTGRLQLLGLERLARRGEERLLYGCRVKSARLSQPIVLPDPLEGQATAEEATIHLISCPGGDRQALSTVLEALARESTY